MSPVESRKERDLLRFGPGILRIVEQEIGDLIYANGYELIPSRDRARRILLQRGFTQRPVSKYDLVKYIAGNIRIHIQAGGKKGKIFYHLDNH